MRVAEIKLHWRRIKAQKAIAKKAGVERRKFLQWAMPELLRIDPQKYRRLADEYGIRVKSAQIKNTEPKELEAEVICPEPILVWQKPSPRFTYTVIGELPQGPTILQLAALTRAREAKAEKQRETKYDRLLGLLEKKLTTQEPLSKNEVQCIRLVNFQSEEDRQRMTSLAKLPENMCGEAAYLLGKNSTAKRYLDGRFKGMIDVELYLWVYENKDHAFSKGLLNTPLKEPAYTDERSMRVAKERIDARAEVFKIFPSWESSGPEKAKDFDVYKHPNEMCLRSELVLFAKDKSNFTNEVSYYLGQNTSLLTPQNARKLVEWATQNPNHYFAWGLALNPKILNYRDINKIANWIEKDENKNTLFAKNLLEQINLVLKKLAGEEQMQIYSFTEALERIRSLQQTA